jgi:NADH-quinone oxidoreductase subunit E
VSLDPRHLPTTGSQTGPGGARSEPQRREGATVSEEILKKIRELPRRFPAGSRSAVMPALDLVQEEIGYLTPAGMAQVAEALELDPGYVEGVATFYSLFHLKPIGKHHFYVCNNLSCQLRGAEEVLAHLKLAFGVREYGEVSNDGQFSCEPVECLGACEYAPVMRYRHRLHYELTSQKIDELLASARPTSFPPPRSRPAEKADG